MNIANNDASSSSNINPQPRQQVEHVEEVQQPQNNQNKAALAQPPQDHNPEDNQQLTEVPTNSRKKCMIITFSIIGVLSALSIILGLVYHFHYKPKIMATTESVINLAPGQNMVIKKIQYTDINFGKDDVIFDVYTTYACKCNKGRLLQEQKITPHYYIDHKNGVITKTSLEGVVQATFIDTDQFVEAILQEEELSKRMLQTELPVDPLTTDEAIQSQYLNVLASIFSQQADQQFKFTNQPYITLSLNAETNQMQIQTPTKQSSRRLLFRFKGIVNKITDSTVKPAVNAIRNNGPAIGAAVGTVAGGAMGAGGGPMGMIAGAQAGRQIGGNIGTIAQAAVNGCVPQDSYRIRCNGKQLINQATTIGKDMAKQAAINAMNQYTAGYPVASVINNANIIRRGGGIRRKK